MSKSLQFIMKCRARLECVCVPISYTYTYRIYTDDFLYPSQIIYTVSRTKKLFYLKMGPTKVPRNLK